MKTRISKYATENKKMIFLLFCFIFCLNSHAQTIVSMSVTPSSPSINDTIELLVTSDFPYSNCPGTTYFSVTGFNVNASALHCLGMLSTICTTTDTIKLYPPHPVGTYNFMFTLDAGSGPIPCTPGIVPYDSDTLSYTVSSPITGLYNLVDAKDIIIFPNPSSNTMGIKSPVNILQLEMFNFLGQKILIENTDSKLLTLSINYLPEGIYFVKLILNKGTIITKQIHIIH